MSLSDIIQFIICVIFIGNLIYVTRRDWYARVITWLPYPVAKFFMWTPNMVSWVMKKLPYKTDEQVYGEADHWATPEEFWNHKCGDCEDYANFAIGVLKDHGYVGQRYDYPVTPEVGHALGVVSKDMENFYVFDLWNVYEVKARTFTGAGDWVRYNIVRLV